MTSFATPNSRQVVLDGNNNNNARRNGSMLDVMALSQARVIALLYRVTCLKFDRQIKLRDR